MEFGDLPFDTARRFLALAEMSRDLPEKARVLDVGGHPGILMQWLGGIRPGWDTLTVDQVADDRPRYRQADGARLPFADAEFDATFSSDCLEHVPAAARHAFVGELCRVARTHVFLGAPFRHPVIDQVETDLCAAHLALTRRPHPWLAEHREHGLPDLETLVASIPRGWVLAEVRGNAPLADWLQWQWMLLAREAHGELDAAWRELDQARVAGLGSGSEGGGPLPYRHVLRLERRAGAHAPAPVPAPQSICTECLALAHVLRGWVLAAVPPAATDVPAALVARLEQALAAAEGEVLRLRGVADEPPAKSPRGILARWFGGP